MGSFRSWGVMAGSLAAALLLRWLLDPMLGDSMPLVTLYGAVALAVTFAGVTPAILTVIAGYVACAYLFIAPRGELGLDVEENLVGFIAHLVTCAIIIAIGGAMRRAQFVADRRAETIALDQRRREGERAQKLSTARLLAAIVESSDDAIISKSLAGIIQTWNIAAEKLFGYRADEAVGKHISLVIPKERLTEEDTIIASLQQGRRIDHFETERVGKRGQMIPVSLTISPIYNDEGRVVGASKIVRDITARKHIESELQTADRRKNEFLATLAHELRNPLAPLSNMLEVLNRDDVDVATRHRAREIMERQLRQLVRLVDDLLDLNRITLNRLELRRSTVQLSHVLHQAVESSLPLADSANQRIVIDSTAESLWLQADPARLAQVFGNLLNNASRYSAAGTTISVTIGREGGAAIVTVRDTGIGIASDKLGDIFQMFTQLDRSDARAQGGLGIGLTLAKQLIEMHGGSIEARSAGLGQGSEFVVRLALVAAPDVLEAESGKRLAAPARRVLVVDDNVDAASSLAMLLAISENDTRVANDGVAAITAAQDFRPHVMLLDIGMPNMSGHEVCRRIRAQDWGADIFIIALTGWGQEEDRRKSAAAGFDGHLVKPVEPEVLERLLASLPAERSAQAIGM